MDQKEAFMNRLITWGDRTYYDINRDEDVARVSGWDQNHQEFWMVILTGKGYADRRKEAVLAIMSAIEAGNLPGEVEE